MSYIFNQSINLSIYIKVGLFSPVKTRQRHVNKSSSLDAKCVQSLYTLLFINVTIHSCGIFLDVGFMFASRNPANEKP